MSQYSDYHHAMAQHAAQLQPTMTQIPIGQMINANGLNLTVMPGQLNQAGHQFVYAANVQPAAAPVTANAVQAPTSNKKNKKAKVNKDGVAAPKRAATPFINFTLWYRVELKKNGQPVPKIAEFGKECAVKWALMSEGDKKPFVETAERSRERYKREMLIYKPPRDESKPKRPGTAFMLFMVDLRKEMRGKEPTGGVAALAKLGGERWRNMMDEEKRPYVECQNTERVRYESSMEDYRRKGQQVIAAQATPEAKRESDQSDSDSLQAHATQQASAAANSAQQQQQIHLAPATTAYLVTNSGALYSQIQTPYNWNN